MRKLSVYIEINGNSIYAGNIEGNDSSDACFTYADEYNSNYENPAISISLPLNKKTFNANQTRNFFEGLLPEGFTRKCVAEWMHADANDYLSLLAGLGNECLGAIKIIENLENRITPKYQLLSQSEVRELAREGATESAQLVTKAHLSLTGASGKVGLYFEEKEQKWYLPLGEAPSTHIVKQSHVRLKKIVANEQLCLLTARNLGIQIPESFIVNTGSLEDEDILFATKRYDRKVRDKSRKLNGLYVPYRLHQEDFAQALGISAIHKYEKNNERYLKQLFDVLRIYSAEPMADQLKLWDICIFNYLVGNTDNHIKNLSLLYGEDLKSIRLAPAYDIISTIVYENCIENMAISIDGIYDINQITREAFEKEAEYIGLGRKIAMKKFDTMVNKFEKAMRLAQSELNEQGFYQVDNISNKILEKGGIKRFL